MKFLTVDSQLECTHQGKVDLSSCGSDVLSADGKKIVTEQRILGAPVSGCTQFGTGVSPCTKVTQVLAGTQSVLTSGQDRPVGDCIVLLTDGSPPAMVTCKDPAQETLQIASGPTVAGPGPSVAPGIPWSIEIMLAAFIDGRYGDDLVEPGGKGMQMLCVLMPTKSVADCPLAHFATDKRGFGEFVWDRMNARVAVRAVLPVSAEGEAEIESVTSEPGHSESHRLLRSGTSGKPDVEVSRKAEVSHSGQMQAGGYLIKTSASYPFLPAPSINTELTLVRAVKVEGMDAVDLTIRVAHDSFPSYELYVNGYAVRLLDAVEEGEIGPGLNLIAFDEDNPLREFRRLLRKELTFRVHRDSQKLTGYVESPADEEVIPRKVKTVEEPSNREVIEKSYYLQNYEGARLQVLFLGGWGDLRSGGVPYGSLTPQGGWTDIAAENFLEEWKTAKGLKGILKDDTKVAIFTHSWGNVIFARASELYLQRTGKVLMDEFELRIRFGSPVQTGRAGVRDFSVTGYWGNVDPVDALGRMFGPAPEKMVLNPGFLQHSMQDYALGSVGHQFGRWILQFQLPHQQVQTPIPRIHLP